LGVCGARGNLLIQKVAQGVHLPQWGSIRKGPDSDGLIIGRSLTRGGTRCSPADIQDSPIRNRQGRGLPLDTKITSADNLGLARGGRNVVSGEQLKKGKEHNASTFGVQTAILISGQPLDWNSSKVEKKGES